MYLPSRSLLLLPWYEIVRYVLRRGMDIINLVCCQINTQNSKQSSNDGTLMVARWRLVYQMLPSDRRCGHLHNPAHFPFKLTLSAADLGAIKCSAARMSSSEIPSRIKACTRSACSGVHPKYLLMASAVSWGVAVAIVIWICFSGVWPCGWRLC